MCWGAVRPLGVPASQCPPPPPHRPLPDRFLGAVQLPGLPSCAVVSPWGEGGPLITPRPARLSGVRIRKFGVRWCSCPGCQGPADHLQPGAHRPLRPALPGGGGRRCTALPACSPLESGGVQCLGAGPAHGPGGTHTGRSGSATAQILGPQRGGHAILPTYQTPTSATLTRSRPTTSTGVKYSETASFQTHKLPTIIHGNTHLSTGIVSVRLGT